MAPAAPMGPRAACARLAALAARVAELVILLQQNVRRRHVKRVSARRVQGGAPRAIRLLLIAPRLLLLRVTAPPLICV